MLTLWDIIEPLAKRIERRPPTPRKPSPAAPRERTPKSRQARGGGGAGKRGGGVQAKYDALTREMLHRYGIRVRKWRTSMSGLAWTITYDDGRVARLIESPRPRGPMSVAIFLHEIGHHAIGLGRYRPRCLEEYHAWAWSLEQMEANGLNITDAVRWRVHASLYYAIAKAERRGIKSLPPELEPYRERPPRRSRAASARA